MGEQSEVKSLVERLETAVSTVISTARQLTAEQWQTIVPEEERSVGTVIHHIAFSIEPVANWVLDVAHGRGLPPFSREALHRFNADHAEKNANPDQATTIALMQHQLSDATQKINSLSDEELTRTLPFELIGGQEISGQKMVEWFTINHCHNHLKTIQEALGMA
jgi:hypothetical protein